MGEGKSFREALKKAKRIVVKVGTSTITYANGKRNFSQIDRLARELSDLQNQGTSVPFDMVALRPSEKMIS